MEVRTNTDDVLTPEAVEFLTLLQREFGAEREELLAARAARAQRLRAGELPDFLEETRAVREGDWRVPPAPPTWPTAESRSRGRPIARW